MAAGPAGRDAGRPAARLPEFWYGWRRQLGPLAAAGLRVVAPDLRGYNLSTKPEGIAAYLLDVLADDVLGLADALGREPVRHRRPRLGRRAGLAPGRARPRPHRARGHPQRAASRHHARLRARRTRASSRAAGTSPSSSCRACPSGCCAPATSPGSPTASPAPAAPARSATPTSPTTAAPGRSPARSPRCWPGTAPCACSSRPPRPRGSRSPSR